MRTRYDSAFTIPEVIFVILLVCVLVFFLIPISGNICTVQPGLKIGTNGRSIVYGILQANTEREALGLPPIWPVAETVLDGETGAVDYTAGFSEKYFADCTNTETVENFTFALFAGGGVPTARNATEFTNGGHNVWSYTGGIPDGADEDTPFLFTQNFRITGDDLRHYATVKNKDKSFAAKLNSETMPYRGQSLVFVTRGGSALYLKAKELHKPSVFYGNSGQNISTNFSVAVVHPK